MLTITVNLLADRRKEMSKLTEALDVIETVEKPPELASQPLNDLLGCPFCGGEAIVNKLSNIYADVYSVSCVGEKDGNCHGLNGGGYCEDEHEAIECWNTRAI